MGHYYMKVTGIGKNQDAAETDAINKFYYEHGHRYCIYEYKTLRLVELVPPQKEVREKHGRNTYISFVPDYDAPKDQWLEKWEFEIHSHA